MWLPKSWYPTNIDKDEGVCEAGYPFCFPAPKSRLNIADGALVFQLLRPRPIFWWRWWQFVLLGFRWEKL